MICAQAIVQFRPHESYEKYLKLLVSVMVLIQLFLPIGSLFTGADGMNALKQLSSFREALEQGMEETERQARETDALLEQMTLEEVRRRMEEQAAASEENTAYSAEDTDGEAEDTKTAGSERGTVTVEVEPVEQVEPILGNGR